MCSTLSWAESKTRIEEEPRNPAPHSVAEENLGLRTLQGLEEDFHISEIRILANGIALDIAWPEGFTNRLDIYRATDLVARDWQPVASMLETVGRSSLSWTHANPVSPMGFYVTGNADLDSDQDALSDAFELYVSGTDPTNPDTDDDGLSDGDEVNTQGTSPLLADSDGDGVSDGQEIADGTDPHDAKDFWARNSGSVIYTGDQTGPIYVDVYRTETHFIERITVGANGLFTTTHLYGTASLSLRAFRDSNANGVADLETEAHARYLIPALIPTEGIHLILKDPDSSGDGYPNWSSPDPGAFIDNNGNGIGDGFEPNPDVPGYWVSADTSIIMPTTAGPHLLEPGLPTNSVLMSMCFFGFANSSFTVEGIDSYELPGYFFEVWQYRRLTNSLADRRTGALSIYVRFAGDGGFLGFSYKKPAPLILPPACNDATHVYSIKDFGISGIIPIRGRRDLRNYVDGIWLQDMVKFCEAKTGTNTSQTVAVTLGHPHDLSLTNLISTALRLPTLTWKVKGDGGSMMATPPLSGAPYGKIILGTNWVTLAASKPYRESQNVQPVVEVDTSWLLVGHVDEVIMFISTNAYLVASPWLAADLLHADIAAGNEANKMWFGLAPIRDRTNTISQVVIATNSVGNAKLSLLPSGGLPGSTNSAQIVFASHTFASNDVLRVNDEILRVTAVSGATVTVVRAQGGRPAQAHDEGARIYALSEIMRLNLPVGTNPANAVEKRIETLTNTLHAAIGSGIEPIPMPVLFNVKWHDDLQKYLLTAATPNVANCLVMNANRIVMAEPGNDAFRNYIELRVPQTVGNFRDFWELHINQGNIHCATAARRELVIISEE